MVAAERNQPGNAVGIDALHFQPRLVESGQWQSDNLPPNDPDTKISEESPPYSPMWLKTQAMVVAASLMASTALTLGCNL